jgi:hypothetical protein
MPEAIGAGRLASYGNMQTNFTPWIITIDEMTSRLRILPIQRKSNPEDAI